MDSSSFENPSGSLVATVHGQKAFVPSSLPPTTSFSDVQQLLSVADQKLGELKGIAHYLPNPYLLIRPLQRREAIASSNIEGTYTSLPELLLLESGVEDQSRHVDTREVLNYVRALQKGIGMLDELPISNRIIHELHRTLLSGLPNSRTGHFPPGEYRSDQNFIGKSKDIIKSRFVPPPPPIHSACMNDLEIFINDEAMHGLPPLVFVALIHYQFETIHPYPDGNGRVGRLLIPLILRNRNLTEQPLLYMSQYFEDNKDEYVDLMLRVSQSSEWTPWIRFFLQGIVESCDKTIETIHNVRSLHDDYKSRCQQARSSALLVRIIDSLLENMIVTVPAVKELTGTSYTAAQNNVNKLIDLGILGELSVGRRPKYYFATELMKIFEN